MYEPINETDATIVETLAASMREHGWIGQPVVVWGDMLITGTHRQAAAKVAEIAMPVIELADVVGADELDRLIAEWGEPLGGWYDVVDAVLSRLPAETIDAWGIQF